MNALNSEVKNTEKKIGAADDAIKTHETKVKGLKEGVQASVRKANVLATELNELRMKALSAEAANQHMQKVLESLVERHLREYDLTRSNLVLANQKVRREEMNLGV